MKALPLALLFLLHISCPALAQEVETDKGKSSQVTYGFETDFNSRYVFRGFAYSHMNIR